MLKPLFLDGHVSNTYSIQIHSNHLDTYEVSEPILTDDEAGTIVTFNHVIKDFVFEELLTYLSLGFGWFLELNSEKHFDIKIDEISLDYSCIVGEREHFTIIHKPTQTEFIINFYLLRSHLFICFISRSFIEYFTQKATGIVRKIDCLSFYRYK